MKHHNLTVTSQCPLAQCFRLPVMLVIAALIFGGISSAYSADDMDTELARISDELAKAIDEAQITTVATVDFTDLQGNTSELGRLIAEELSTNLVTAKKKFTVVDRSNLKSIMAEYKLTMSGLVDPENAKKLGQVSGVSAIITGSITPIDDTMHVSVKVIATDTAKIVTAAKGKITKTPALEKLAGVVTEATSSQETPGETPADKSKPNPETSIKISEDLSATINSVKRLKDKSFELYVTFSNKSAHEIAVFAGNVNVGQQLKIIASDNNGNEYKRADVFGFSVSSQSPYNIFRGGNQYVVISTKEEAQVRIDVGAGYTIPDDPESINFTAELCILNTENKKHYDKTLNLLNYKLQM